MMTTAQDVLNQYVQLPIAEKRKVISALLRESLDIEIETPEMSDEELVFNAEELFLELDRREAENGES